MAETNSTDVPMAESTQNLSMKARDVLATPNHEGLAMIVDQLFLSKESEEYKTALALFDFCVSDFPNCLTLILLKIYRFATEDVVRSRSIHKLSEILTELRNRKFELSLVALLEIKPLLISCLEMESIKKCDMEFLRIIVSCVTENVMLTDDCGWEELSDFLLSLAYKDPIRAFDFFIDLPSLYEEFINRFVQKFLEEVYKVLLHPAKDKVEDWILALKAAVKMGIQLMDCEMRVDLSNEILGYVLNSASEVLWLGMEKEFLQRGLQDMEKFLAKDAKLCKWCTAQCGFVAEFAFGISDVGKHTMEPAKKIYHMVTLMENYVQNPAFKLSPVRVGNQDLGLKADRDLYNQLRECTALEILKCFVISGPDYRSRETAIRRLHHVLIDHSLNQELDVSEIRNLQPLLITCLKEEKMPENIYRVLGQVVFYVAQEIFSYEKDPWFDLWDYIGSESKAEFKKAVYVFQCLTMRLDFKDFVVPAISNLLTEMKRNLTPPREVLFDNSSWVLTFTGAYCAAIHLLEIPSHAGFVKEIAHKMIDAVIELVGSGNEIGLVRRAFRDLETIVDKQWDWYMTCEYRFVKGLLWRLYAIKGMKMESKIVLWRINVKLERSVNKELKVIPKTEFDWLNQPETY